MNVYLMVDAEGLCGVHRAEAMREGSPLYAALQEQMTEEVNHVLQCLKEAGAGRVWVRDAHSSGTNLLWPKLSSLAAGYIQGDTRTVRMPGIEECDAVMLLGYHAMAGTQDAILEHTMSSRRWQNAWLNDRPCGEIAIDAAIAGEYGKPVILVSGDDRACAEACDWLPQVVTVAVKKALGLEGAMHLPKVQAYELLRQKIHRAMQLLQTGRPAPLQLPKPIRLRIECVERAQIPPEAARPDLRRLDARTYEVEAKRVETALARL